MVQSIVKFRINRTLCVRSVRQPNLPGDVQCLFIFRFHYKLSFFFVVLILLTAASAFTARVEAQEVSTEEKRATVQEFVKKAQEFVHQTK